MISEPEPDDSNDSDYVESASATLSEDLYQASAHVERLSQNQLLKRNPSRKCKNKKKQKQLSSYKQAAARRNAKNAKREQNKLKQAKGKNKNNKKNASKNSNKKKRQEKKKNDEIVQDSENSLDEVLDNSELLNENGKRKLNEPNANEVEPPQKKPKHNAKKYTRVGKAPGPKKTEPEWIGLALDFDGNSFIVDINKFFQNNCKGTIIKYQASKDVHSNKMYIEKKIPSNQPNVKLAHKGRIDTAYGILPNDLICSSGNAVFGCKTPWLKKYESGEWEKQHKDLPVMKNGRPIYLRLYFGNEMNAAHFAFDNRDRQVNDIVAEGKILKKFGIPKATHYYEKIKNMNIPAMNDIGKRRLAKQKQEWDLAVLKFYFKNKDFLDLMQGGIVESDKIFCNFRDFDSMIMLSGGYDPWRSSIDKFIQFVGPQKFSKYIMYILII